MVDKGANGMTRNTMALASRGDWCCRGSRRFHQANHKSIPFRDFIHWAQKLSPRNQEETRIAAQERKAFDFEVGDGWKDFSPNLLHSNDFSETKCFYTVTECTSLQSLRLVAQSQRHLAGKRYGCLYCLSINLMIVHLSKPQQVYSTSVNLLFGTGTV